MSQANERQKKLCLYIRDEFELEFSGSSCEISEPSWALQFSSWNRADNADNMYVKK